MPQDEAIIESALALVERDIREGFEGTLDAEGPNAFVIGLHGATLDVTELVAPSDSAVVPVPWTFRCRHNGMFLGIPATLIEMDLRGTTFVLPRGDDAEQWMLFRYIDYLSVLHQMGVSTSVRPALTQEEYENWLVNRAGGDS
jgi:hypothetical protein